MTVLVRTAAVTMLGVTLAACGGSGDSEESAIRDSFRQFFAAFAESDVVALENLLDENCEDRRATASNAIGNFQVQFPGDVDFDVTGVEVQNLTETTVDASPVGTFRVDGQESALSAEGEELAELVKVDGKWKFANCNVVFG